MSLITPNSVKVYFITKLYLEFFFINDISIHNTYKCKFH